MQPPVTLLLALAFSLSAALVAAEGAAAAPAGLRGAQGFGVQGSGAQAPDPPALVRPARRAAPGYAVQIGVFNSAKIANERWTAIRREFGVDAKARRLRVIPIALNGRQVFRAQVAGFPSRSAAVRFCETLRRSERACFVPPARR